MLVLVSLRPSFLLSGLLSSELEQSWLGSCAGLVHSGIRTRVRACCLGLVQATSMLVVLCSPA